MIKSPSLVPVRLLNLFARVTARLFFSFSPITALALVFYSQPSFFLFWFLLIIFTQVKMIQNLKKF